MLVDWIIRSGERGSGRFESMIIVWQDIIGVVRVDFGNSAWRNFVWPIFTGRQLPSFPKNLMARELKYSRAQESLLTDSGHDIKRR